jgi:hypothetical protein
MKKRQQPNIAPTGTPHYGNQYGEPAYYGQAAYGGEGGEEGLI